MFQVMVQVSGGVTGTRRAFLKDNGTILEFETREEAEAEAQAYRARMNGQTHYFRPASFSAWVVEDGTPINGGAR